jgi:putative flippase GtrA
MVFCYLQAGGPVSVFTEKPFNADIFCKPVVFEMFTQIIHMQKYDMPLPKKEFPSSGKMDGQAERPASDSIPMKKNIKTFLADKDNHFVQFIKYSLCGGVATVVDMGVFFLFAWQVFPALTQSDPFAQLLFRCHQEIQIVSEALRLRNYWLDKTVSFFFSNFTAYILNVLFVFKAGKHKRHHELMLFYAVSLVSFVMGTFAGDLLIRFAGLDTTYSYIAAAVAALLINYTGRKFFIFHG